ncbi:MAG: 2-oxoglutarate dehydrogenase E1 component [Chlamydiia bacterium]|nr:2-oxoglutarate dehydrogenase E1 component [Chlamydiia bacterium]
MPMHEREGFANLANIGYIEELYSQYLEDPGSVEASWQHFFEGVSFGAALKGPGSAETGSSDCRVMELIGAYRREGHRCAHFNPLGDRPKEIEELSLKAFGFTEEELSKNFPTHGLLKEKEAPLKVIVEALKNIYCNVVGFESLGTEAESFIRDAVEQGFSKSLSAEEKREILHHLNRSEIMESFIQMKYPGQKRFSLEGGETLIPMMMEIIEEGGAQGVTQVVLGMAHRGRLNVLANILGKSYGEIFYEFEPSYMPDTFEGSGDVKYHKGYSSDLQTKQGKKVHIALCANPSHLEAVDPVVEGKTRAKQELNAGGKTDTILPILIHGDAAIAGQGVVYETLQLSKLNGYQTGGTVHIVINNQVGFTASPRETKSTRYCTDIAKCFGAPVFHVNGEEPESAVAAAKLALQVRQKFGCDVFLELNCHRKYGHNESDEPAFTQPKEYQLIKQKQNARVLYRERLIQEGVLSKEEAGKLEEEFKASLEKALEEKKAQGNAPAERKAKGSLLDPVNTAVPLDRLIELAKKFTTVPEGFKINPKLGRHLEDRLKAIAGDPKGKTIDWGNAEHLAYATLLTEKIHVRLSGQDSRRGTFSHRHAALTDQETGERYFPLSHLSDDQALFDVFNSPLSEYAVMGFEYGYSLAYQEALIMWEGQFGDFANGAQIVIDQFIVSAEQKWNRLSPLTLLLPHGYEGQGPEHSSGRIERFLQLAGNDSLTIVTPSTAAQHFHALRRQGIRETKKPLIIFTPKKMLRFPPSLSSPEEIANGSFQEVIDDTLDPKSVKRLLFCSGKIYYDLIEARKERPVAIIRIEQLYPLHIEKIKEVLNRYSHVTEIFWAQEEHENMGAYSYIRPYFENLFSEKQHLGYVGRKISASPAAGSSALHKQELAELLNKAFE